HLHAMGIVLLNSDIFFRDGLPEAGPTRAGLELGLGIKQNRIAADAVIQAVSVVVGVLTRARNLGPGLARHLELFRRNCFYHSARGFSTFSNSAAPVRTPN